MFSILLRLTLAWGFSVKAPKEAKAQTAFSLPPPTTLSGALCKQLAMENGVGEVAEENGKLVSAASRYVEIFKAASAFMDVSKASALKAALGKYSEDPIRHQIHQFQRVDRRGLHDYRYNIVPAGKIYSPSSSLVVGFLGDEKTAEKKLGAEWLGKIVRACYGITNIGAKESIVSVEDVTVDTSPQVLHGDFTTRFYLPKHVVKQVVKTEPSVFGLGGTYVERFWQWRYVWGEEPVREDYIVPGTRDPVVSSKMTIRPQPGVEVFMVGEDGLAVFS